MNQRIVVNNGGDTQRRSLFWLRTLLLLCILASGINHKLWFADKVSRMITKRNAVRDSNFILLCFYDCCSTASNDTYPWYLNPIHTGTYTSQGYVIDDIKNDKAKVWTPKSQKVHHKAS